MRANLIIAIALNTAVFFSCAKGNAEDSPVNNIDTLPIIENQPAASLLTGSPLGTIYTQRSWQGIPSIEITGDKHLVVAWYSGGKGEGPGNYVTVAESVDRGASWKKNGLIVVPPDSNYRVFDPGLWKDNIGTIHLFWAQSKGWWDGKGGVWTCVLNFSGESITPGPPKSLTDGVMINKPIYLPGSKKTILMPISLWRQNPTPTVNSGAYIVRSSYDAVSDKFLILNNSKILEDNNIRVFDEHQIVATGDNDLLCLLRTQKGIYYSVSIDNGKNWSTAAAFTLVGTTTESRFHIQKLKSGNLLLIVNASSGRTNLKAFLSKDGGRTWPYSILIDARNNVSYPDACEGSNGAIYVVYDRNRTSDKEINLAKFNEKDFFSKEAKATISIIDK